MRIAIQARKRLWPSWNRQWQGFRIPLLGGVVKLIIARGEVRRALAQEVTVDRSRSANDLLLPESIPSVIAGDRANRVIARLDQDGFAFAVDERDAILFPTRGRELPRERYRLDIVILNGSICVRKQFVRQSLRSGFRNWWWNLLGLPFYNEAAALLRLRGCLGTPQIHRIDMGTRSIYLDYIRGSSLRHHVGEGGAPIHDLDLDAHDQFRHLSSDQRTERERAIFLERLGADGQPLIRDLVLGMNQRGVAVLDVKLGNILVGDHSRALYWVDFERAHLRPFPGWDRALCEQSSALNRSFGLRLDA